MKGQLGPRKVNKLVVSRNPENTQCGKKMRNTVDSSNSFVPFSPDTMKSAALEYLAREKKRVAIDKTPASFNFYGNLRHDISEKQQIFENRNVQFKEVPWSFSFENEDVKPSQPVIVDGTDITADIPEHTRISYFDLCRTQSTLLHIGLTEGIHLQHAVFIICETVAIATAIKSCDISTPQKDILYWGKALDSYSSLGMDVGFLRSRVSRLLEIKTNAAKTMDRKKDIEAKTEKERNEDKINRFELDIEEMIKKIGELEMEIENMREQNRKFDDERESIRKRVEEFEAMFRIEASSPW